MAEGNHGIPYYSFSVQYVINMTVRVTDGHVTNLEMLEKLQG